MVEELEQLKVSLVSVGPDGFRRFWWVLVKSSTCLVPVVSRVDGLLNGFGNFRARCDLRGEISVNGGLNVETAEVMDHQRTESREPEAHTATDGSVDVLDRGDAAIQEIPDFALHRDLDSVDQKSRQFLVDANGEFARPAQEGQRRFDGLFRRLRAADNLYRWNDV